MGFSPDNGQSAHLPTYKISFTFVSNLQLRVSYTIK
jgi:hypothetical protein